MASCDYYVLQDIYETIDTKLDTIASNIADNKFELNIDELDIDLDNIEKQLTIANKLALLDAVGVDIMTEEEQKAAYTAIKDELFSATVEAGGDSMSESDVDDNI